MDENIAARLLASSRPLLEDETGLSTTEYIMILILISIVGIIAWQLFGESVSAKTEEAEAELRDMGAQNAAGGGGSGMGGGGGGGGGSPDGVEGVGEGNPNDPAAGGRGGESGDTAMMGGGRAGVQAQGVVNREEGDMPVYTAPSEDESDNSVLITIVIVVFLMFAAIGLLAKVREKA